MKEDAMAAAHTRERYLETARWLAPRFADRAARTEGARTLGAESVRDIVESGMVRALLPRRYGGSELDFGVVLDVCLELGWGCASSAWMTCLFMNHAWVVGLFPRAAQDEVWGENGDTLVATRVSFHGNEAVRSGDELRLTGRWPQTSGVEHSAWVALCANEVRAEGPETLFCLVPRADVRVQDTWFSMGLRGSGSQTVVADGVLVPAHRVIRFRDFMDGTCPGGRLPGAAPLYRLPASGGYMAILAAPILGAAQGALEACVAFAKKTRGGPGSLSVAHQVAIARAAAELDGATLLLRRHFETSMATVAAGRSMTFRERARGRRDAGFVANACNHALTTLLDEAGAPLLYDASPVQRAWRDIRMMAAHPALHFATVGELWTCAAHDLPLPEAARAV
jgi:3-hydroxy-9,10-secoandrosta-1,3,5(10)-triene-9,17-dione monooxygenase